MKSVRQNKKIDKFAGSNFSKFVTNIEGLSSILDKTQYLPSQLFFSSNTNFYYPANKLNSTLKLKSTTTDLNPIFNEILIKFYQLKQWSNSPNLELFLIKRRLQKTKPKLKANQSIDQIDRK